MVFMIVGLHQNLAQIFYPYLATAPYATEHLDLAPYEVEGMTQNEY